MSTSPGQANGPLKPIGPAHDAGVKDSFYEQAISYLMFSRATELARAGWYRAAEMVLESLLSARLSPRTVDLLARVQAQQGRLMEAKRLWTQLAASDPNDGAARAALARIDHIQRRSERWRRFRSWLCRLALVLRWRRLIRCTIVASRGNLDLGMAAPGVMLESKDRETIVSFAFPLFLEATATLDNRGGETLTELGRQIERHARRVSVSIVGYLDPMLRDSGVLPRQFRAMGMARAIAVFEHLISTTELDARIFTLCTGDGFQAAGSNVPECNHSGQCQLVLRISSVSVRRNT